MKKARRIYCIEGHHDWGDGKIEPTVEPMLQLLCSTGYWDEYVHRKCATANECYFYLEEEWNHRCLQGSILYFASHGGPGAIWLSGSPGEPRCEVVTLDTLVERELDCTNCLVHFSCCSVFADGGEEKVKEFVRHTEASYASGYAIDVGWADIKGSPSLALELMFFGSIREQDIDIRYGYSAKSMRRLARDLDDLFKLRDRKNVKPVEFRLCDWWDVTQS